MKELRQMVKTLNKKVKIAPYSKLSKNKLIDLINNHDAVKVIEGKNAVKLIIKSISVEGVKTEKKPKKTKEQKVFEEPPQAPKKEPEPEKEKPKKKKKFNIVDKAPEPEKEKPKAISEDCFNSLTQSRKIIKFYTENKGIFSKDKYLIKNKKELQEKIETIKKILNDPRCENVKTTPPFKPFLEKALNLHLEKAKPKKTKTQKKK